MTELDETAQSQRPGFPVERLVSRDAAKKKPENECPFCGHHAAKLFGPKDCKTRRGWQVECINCGARGPCGMATQRDAVLVWDVGDLGHMRAFVPANAEIERTGEASSASNALLGLPEKGN